jgi:nitrogen fixation-related uncharacterized protein
MRKRVSQAATILWSLAVAVLLLVLLGTFMLPSTKRGSFDYEEWLRERELQDQREAATKPATQPHLPTTRAEGE